MTTQQTGPKVTVYLASRKDWDNWFPVAKSTAKALQIWEYVDPDLEAEPTLPKTPTKPPVSAIKEGTTTIAVLKGDDLSRARPAHKVHNSSPDTSDTSDTDEGASPIFKNWSESLRRGSDHEI